MNWLTDIKDSDKVALLILLLGVGVCMACTVCYMIVVYHSGTLYEAVEDRALAGIKDFFAVGTSLIAGALLALKLQSKSENQLPPPKDEPPKP